MRHRLILAAVGLMFGSLATTGASAEPPSDFPAWPFDVLVRDEAGNPIPRAHIRCGKRWCLEDVRDGEGSFVAQPGLPNGLWFRIERPQDSEGAAIPLAPVMVEVPSTPPGPSLRLAVVLPPATHIAGRVVGPDGRGVARARVWAHDLTRRRWLGEEREDSFDTVVTDADGRFDLGGRAAVAHELAVTPDSWEYLPTVMRGVVGGRTDVRVVLPTTVSVTVTVRNPRGIPVEHALVIAERTDSEPWWASIVEARTNTHGVGVLEHLDPNGTYELLAGGPGEGLFRKERWRPGDVGIRLPPVRSIRGTVRDPRGAPLPGVHVEWLGRPPPAPAGILGPHFVVDRDGVDTGADGSFELLRLPEGEICVTYALSGVRGGPTARQVVPADSTAANQTFDPGESITVRLDSRENASTGVDAMLCAGPGGIPLRGATSATSSSIAPVWASSAASAPARTTASWFGITGAWRIGRASVPAMSWTSP
jgi:hypothetical protein